MDEEVVQLRNDGRGDISGALTGDRDKHAELTPLLDDLFELLKSIVLPGFALSVNATASSK